MEEAPRPLSAIGGPWVEQGRRTVDGHIVRTWRDLWAPLAAEAHTECQRRRTRVLAYPDLAEALTRPPLGFKEPKQWNGYVPPRTDAEEACGPSCGHSRACQTREHLSRVNSSPRRRALVEIAAEAWRRCEGSESGADE